MALNSPPPYFPQGIQEPNPNRYRKFKLIVAAVIVAAIVLLGGLGFGVYYLIRILFAA